MAPLTRARVLRGATAVPVEVAPPVAPRTLDRIARAEVEARELGARLIAEARQASEALIAEARAKAAGVAQSAAREASEAELAKLAAARLALHAREQRSAEVGLDRTVELARVLAERLLGESLRVDEQTVAKLARQALAEAQGARKLRIDAHPDDVAALERHLALLPVAEVASVAADATLHRGSLRLHTDLGTIDADLRPQLERLAEALRDALRA